MLMFDIVKACKIGDCALHAGHGRGWLGIEGWALDIDRRFIPDRDIQSTIVDKARLGNSSKYSEYLFPKTMRIDN